MDVDGLAREGKWRSWGRAFTNASGERGWGPKPETEHNDSVAGCIKALRSAGGFCEVGDPPAAVI